MRKDHPEDVVIPPREQDGQPGAWESQELRDGDVERSKGTPVFRDCRGELVWLD